MHIFLCISSQFFVFAFVWCVSFHLTQALFSFGNHIWHHQRIWSEHECSTAAVVTESALLPLGLQGKLPASFWHTAAQYNWDLHNSALARLHCKDGQATETNTYCSPSLTALLLLPPLTVEHSLCAVECENTGGLLACRRRILRIFRVTLPVKLEFW